MNFSVARGAVRALIGACLAGVSFTAAAPSHYSALWGREGEHWTPQSRLPDFSYAGYRRGEAPLRTVKSVANVKGFGAKVDVTARRNPGRKAGGRT